MSCIAERHILACERGLLLEMQPVIYAASAEGVASRVRVMAASYLACTEVYSSMYWCLFPPRADEVAVPRLHECQDSLQDRLEKLHQRESELTKGILPEKHPPPRCASLLTYVRSHRTACPPQLARSLQAPSCVDGTEIYHT